MVAATAVVTEAVAQSARRTAAHDQRHIS